MKYTRENLTAYIDFEMSKHLEENSFLRSINDGDVFYKKEYDWGWDYCSLNRVLFLETHLQFGINFSRRYEYIEAFWQEWAELIQINYSDVNLMTTLTVNHSNASEEIQKKKYFDGSLRFEISEKGLAEIPEAIEYVINKILIKLDFFLNLKNVDNLINSQLEPITENNEIFRRDGGFMFKRMILAKITGNNMYDAICHLYKSRFSKIIDVSKTPGKEYFLNYPIVFDKVYEKLKNVEQWENKILYTTDKIKVPFNEAIVIEVKSNQHPKRLLPIKALKNNSEIKNFTNFNDDGMIIPIKIGFGVNMFDNVSKQEYIDYINCYSKQSMSWEYEGQKIILEDKNESINAYPSLDLKYVIAIYEGLDGEHKPPSNAVIYNADGSIHTILKMPVLESENILERIDFNKDSNPPIEAALFEGGLQFSNFDWWQNEEGNLVNRIQIIYDRDWIEWRELEIRTGEVGSYLAQGKL
ncbi:hypothetical protein MW871_14065 [Flavobacterium sp. I-SCBP12n]|uniref:Uncharacterized protein n=1 Tax=Flavobacterium pygoscelis TaxID=2893176 RepID=A0A9X2BPF5_9FLAO|nr:hypothetical protein [Flavobacterium pygoscelis]MCK8143020.1 hypothetical protein [Flavobacterium pygoscelis]